MEDAGVKQLLEGAIAHHALMISILNYELFRDTHQVSAEDANVQQLFEVFEVADHAHTHQAAYHLNAHSLDQRGRYRCPATA